MSIEEAAANLAENDHEDCTDIDDPATVKRDRTKAKKGLLELLAKVATHIKDRGSRGGVTVLRSNVVEALETCASLNTRYIALKGLEGTSKGNAERYYSLLESAVSTCFKEIDQYITSRAGEAPSSIASRSYRSIASSKTSSARLREAQQSQGEAELRLRQIEEENARELEEGRRLRELELRLEEERRALELDRRRREQANEVERRRLATTAAQQDLLEEQAMSSDDSEIRSCSPNSSSSIQQTSEQAPRASFPQGSVTVRAGHTTASHLGNLSIRKESSKSLETSAHDAWIFSDESEATKRDRSTQPWNLAHLSKLEIKPFNGDPKEWPMFQASFKSLVHDVVSSDAQRLAYLRELLAPNIRKGIAHTLQSPMLYRQALRELYERYGQPHIVSRAYVGELLEIPPLKGNEFTSLQDFYAELHGAVTTLLHANYTGDLFAPSVLDKILDKLPQRLRSSWGMEQQRLLPASASLLDFDKWLGRHVMAELLVQPVHHQARKSKGTEPKKDHGKRERPPSIHTTSGTTGSSGSLSSRKQCPLCEGNHSLPACGEFASLNLTERARVAKEKTCCFSCLKPGHLSKDCRGKQTCGVNECKAKHHSSLHGAPRVFNAQSRDPNLEQAPGVTEAASGTHHVGATREQSTRVTTLLSVVPVRLSANGKNLDTFTLLDNGSEVTLLREDVARKLGLRGPTRQMRFGTFHGQDPPIPSQDVSLRLSSRDDGTTFDIEHARTVPRLNLSQRRINWPIEKRKWRHLADLPLSEINSSQVTLLIGLDVPDAHDCLSVRKPPPGVKAPRAVLTPFGWCASGALQTSGSASQEELRVNFIRTDTGSQALELVDLVHKFWSADSLGVRVVDPPKRPEDQRALRILQESTKNIGRRYECSLLWKVDQVELPDNRSSALRRFFSLERKLLRDPALSQRYAEVIDEYVRLGHARKLRPEEVSGPAGKTWYVPHHGVTHPNRPGKLRVVFDASAKHAGTSLNSNLMQGPDLLTNLLGIFLRFRRNLVPLSADIEKMYHQVRVSSDDQDALRFLWRTPGSDVPPQSYKMQVHIFGAVSSPTVCIHALLKNGKDFQAEFPDVSGKIATCFYVDNYLDSVDTEEEAITVARHLTELLKRGGFRLTKWLSSSRNVLNSFAPRDLSSANLNLDLDPLPVERTLGVLWNCQTDEFAFQFQQCPAISTKREILSKVASIYDPLGFLAPVVLSAKILLQDIWRTGSDWDDILPNQILATWNAWVSGLVNLENLAVPRCLRTAARPVKEELHIFTDACQRGFGAVAYLRTSYSDCTVSVRLVMAKTRVARLQPLTIPRLELEGAVLGSRLAATCSLELGFPHQEVTFWTDSQTVLQWINSRSKRFQTFVGNRIGEILEKTSCSQWRHVPGVANPADDCSRGLMPDSLHQDHRWFHGPEFLMQPPQFWPPSPSVSEPSDDDPEVARDSWVGAVRTDGPNCIAALMDRCSTFLKGQRVIAWALRFVKSCKGLPVSSNLLLNPEELSEAFNVCIRTCQLQSFRREVLRLQSGEAVEKDSSLLSLNPYLDEVGLLRVGGRLQHSTAAIDVKHPVILPFNHRVTELIIDNTHRATLHSSTERTLHELRMKFWIVRARSAIRKVINRCFTCKRNRAQPLPPLMAPLPADRLRSFSPPFSHVSIDYFGPLHVVVRRSTEKRWGCLFTCLVTRAVHLELSRSLDTDSFLMCFRRFVGRRGQPITCYSDNGTNLTSGERELRECVESWDQNKLHDALAVRGIKWHFSPPSAPHFGGVWERLVRSAKSALKAVLRNRSVNDEVLGTVLVEVESLLNGRPLTHISVDPSDPEPLTPTHFLLGRPNPNVPPDVITDEDIVSKKRWRAAQAITNHFWRRWMREYMPYLVERRKWLEPRRNLHPGDVVLIADPSSHRGSWPLGRVASAKPGPDGIVRAVSVKTKTGEYVRPVAKLCLLEQSS